MRPNRADALAWESRWSRPAGVASLATIVLFVASFVAAGQIGGADGDSELLRNIDAHRDAKLISSILQALASALLAVPLYFLFRAAKARSEAMRGQLVGVAIAGPLFLAVLAILTGVTTLSAASDFVADEVPRLMSEGVALNSDRADEIASDTVAEAPLSGLVVGFLIGGYLGFTVGMLYTALHAMRTGLLTRFWGSLGMALAAVSVFFLQFTLLWFVYLGLLLLGWVPGGRPPAWQTGEAMPWPTPGEKTSEEIEAPESGEGGERRL